MDLTKMMNDGAQDPVEFFDLNDANEEQLIEDASKLRMMMDTPGWEVLVRLITSQKHGLVYQAVMGEPDDLRERRGYIQGLEHVLSATIDFVDGVERRMQTKATERPERAVFAGAPTRGNELDE